MLRAVRYEQRYNFEMGKRTLQLLLEARPLIERISGDRVRHEIDNILAEERATQMLDRTQELGILEAIHADLVWDDWVKNHLINLVLPSLEWKLEPALKGLPLKRILAYTLWLMRLPAPRARKVTKRLRVSSVIAGSVQDACHLWADLPALEHVKPSVFTSRLDKASAPAIYAVYLACENGETKHNLLVYIRDWQYVSQKNTGHDLQARGLPPGPHYKDILTQLRNAWLDGEVTSEEEEANLLVQIVKEIGD
jgi:tRNA nucleotidyltransferase (CCA-adding enzyme)